MELLKKKVQKFWDFGVGRTALAAFCAHSVSISIGICQGYSAILIPQIQATLDLTPERISWIASCGAITNPIGSILSGVISEYWGRKRSMQITALPFLIGWLFIAFGSDLQWIYAGRLITGIAAGMSAASYTYVSEISTPETRGVFNSLGPICASFGILLTYILGYFLNWATIALIATIFALFTLISMHLFPESPAYLVKTNLSAKGFESFLFFNRNNVQAKAELAAIDLVKKKTSFSAFLRPETIKPFFLLVILFALQSLSGIYTILFYAIDFFGQSGLDLDNYIASIIVGSIRFLFAIVAAFFVNRIGRKVLLMVSSAGMALTLVPLFFPIENAGFLPLACTMLNVLFSMIGMLPIPWLLVGELFPLAVRSIMGGLVICLAQCCVFISVKLYPDVVQFVGFQGAVGVFALGALIACLYTWAFVPETRNCSLEMIEAKFCDKQDKFGQTNPAFNDSV